MSAGSDIIDAGTRPQEVRPPLQAGLWSSLCCPYCGGSLEFSSDRPEESGRGFGLLRCHCDEYPVVAGIPIIKKGRISEDSRTATDVAALIRAKAHDEALISMTWGLPRTSREANWLKRLLTTTHVSGKSALSARLLDRQHQGAALLEDSERTTVRELFALYFRRPDKDRSRAFDYFMYRFGQPRHLTALSLLELVENPQKPLLDLGCGFGHVTQGLVAKSMGQPVVGVDNNFFTLYVAKHWIAPQAEYVCCDGDQSLPFADQSFSNLLCINSFHTFANKLTCVRESRRVTDPQGVIVFAALRHNRIKGGVDVPTLPLEEYQALLGDLPAVLISDESILTRYLEKRGPDLSVLKPVEALLQEPFVSMVASRRGEAVRSYDTFDEWPHARGELSVNPLYERVGDEDSEALHLRLRLPSEAYAQENAECRRYLPENAVVEDPAHIEENRHLPEIEQLIGRCVLLHLPPRYS